MSYATENNSKVNTSQLQELTKLCNEKALNAGFEAGTMAFAEYTSCIYQAEILLINFTQND